MWFFVVALNQTNQELLAINDAVVHVVHVELKEQSLSIQELVLGPNPLVAEHEVLRRHKRFHFATIVTSEKSPTVCMLWRR